MAPNVDCHVGLDEANQIGRPITRFDLNDARQTRRHGKSGFPAGTRLALSKLHTALVQNLNDGPNHWFAMVAHTEFHPAGLATLRMDGGVVQACL